MKKKLSILTAIMIMITTMSVYASTGDAIVHNGVTMFPVRTIAEKFNAKTEWDSSRHTATILFGSKTLEIKVGDKIGILDGTEIAIDHPVAMMNGRVYLSEMALEKLLGVTVSYDGDMAKISVTLKKDIVDVLSNSEDFKTLTAAVGAAGLADALKGAGPFTVFAPTDKAFEKLPEGTVETLLLAENKDKLTDILKYHVVSGKVLAADAIKLTSAKMLNGKEAKIELKDGKVFIDGANIIFTDVIASNGVIHVIDTVMLPD